MTVGRRGGTRLDVTAARVAARPLGSAYVALAALMWSLAGILQRQLHMNLASQLAGRAMFAFFALLGRLADEPVHARTWAAMGVAVAGCAVMAGAPTRPGLAGTVFSLITTLTFSATIVVARRKAEVSMAPATCLSQVLVFAVFAPFAHAGELTGPNLGYLALLGIAQMGLGLFFLSLGARLISAANVALISQLENVLGPLWVWLAGIEHPSAPTIAGGIIVIAAVVMAVTWGKNPVRGFRRQPELDLALGAGDDHAAVAVALAVGLDGLPGGQDGQAVAQ